MSHVNCSNIFDSLNAEQYVVEIKLCTRYYSVLKSHSSLITSWLFTHFYAKDVNHKPVVSVIRIGLENIKFAFGSSRSFYIILGSCNGFKHVITFSSPSLLLERQKLYYCINYQNEEGKDCICAMGCGLEGSCSID